MAQIEIKGVIGQDYTYKQFITDYSNAKGELINLFINSPGGYVEDGKLIAEFVRTHEAQFARVINSGDVASIAASIFLALPFEKRFFDVAKGVALIHNPFATTLGEDTTAEGLRTMSEMLLNEQKEIQNFIAKQTGADSDVISALMKINEPLSESQLTSINFANIIKYQAVAILKTTEMNKQELEQTIDTKMGSWFDRVMAKLFPFKALMLTDADGGQVEFPEVEDGVPIKVGDKVNKPDGDVLLASGETLVIEGGVIKEIKPEAAADKPEEPNAELEALKAKIEALEAEKAALTAKAEMADNFKAQLANIKSEMINVEPAQSGAVEGKSRISNLRNNFK